MIPGQQGGVDIPPTTDIGLIEPKQEPPDCTYPVVTPGGLLIPKAEPDFDCEVDSGPLAKPALADDLLQVSVPTSLAQDVFKAPEALNTLDADTTEGNAEVKQEQADEISVEEFSLDNPDSAEFNFKRKRAAVDDLTQNTSGPSIKRPRPDIRSESAPILLENLDDSQVDSKEDVLRQAQLPPEPPEKKWYHGTEYRCQVCTGLFYKVNALILHVREWHARTIQDYKTEFGDLKTKQLEYTCQVCEKPVGHEQDIIEG